MTMTDTNIAALGLAKAVIVKQLEYWSGLSPQVTGEILDKAILQAMHQLNWQGHIHSFSMRPYSGGTWKYRRLLFVRLDAKSSLHCISLGIGPNGGIYADDYEWGAVESLYMPMLLTQTEGGIS